MTGQQIVLIGASSGLGLAVAKLLAQKGAAITIAGRSPAKLSDAAKEFGPGVTVAEIDILNEQSVQSFFSNSPSIDHLLCFAGDSMAGGVLTADMTVSRNAVESKFWGQFYVGRFGGPKIKPSGSLTFTSGSGPRPHQAIATVVANTGVSLLAESLAKELAPVRVNVVAPYYMDTPMWKGMEQEKRQALFARVGAQLPIGFVSKPEDVAPTYLHILESTYLTGVTIPINGGALLQTVE